jgi:DNA-binding LacI/PurR family transcriptional regulator
MVTVRDISRESGFSVSTVSILEFSQTHRKLTPELVARQSTARPPDRPTILLDHQVALP